MSDVFARFNDDLNSTERFDVIKPMKDSIKTKPIDRENPNLAIQVDGNWGGSWGVSGADQPHRSMNLVGTLSLGEFDGKEAFNWQPEGKGYGSANVNPSHYIIVADETALESSLSAAIESINQGKSDAMSALLAQFNEAMEIVEEKGLDIETRRTELRQNYVQAKACADNNNERQGGYWIPKFLESAKNAVMSESIDINRWGKLAGILKG